LNPANVSANSFTFIVTEFEVSC